MQADATAAPDAYQQRNTIQYHSGFASVPALDTPHSGSLRHDARVIGVVGFAHMMSHFFQLALPPLFPLLRAEFGTSYAVLGTLVGVYYAASGVSQFASGFAVDRFGARPLLLAGLALAVGGILLAGLVLTALSVSGSSSRVEVPPCDDRR